MRYVLISYVPLIFRASSCGNLTKSLNVGSLKWLYTIYKDSVYTSYRTEISSIRKTSWLRFVAYRDKVSVCWENRRGNIKYIVEKMEMFSILSW
jgi:hypothetical protein